MKSEDSQMNNKQILTKQSRFTIMKIILVTGFAFELITNSKERSNLFEKPNVLQSSIFGL